VTLGVALFGTGFMARAHSRAFAALAQWDLPVSLQLVSVAGRNEQTRTAIRQRYGWYDSTADWEAQVRDPRVQLFDNCAPNNLHAEPTAEAIRHGKHVICEKPLARTADEAWSMWKAADDAGVVHMCAFNYRFFPALRLARDLITAGELGKIGHYRSRFLVRPTDAASQTPWRLRRESAGSGALGDLGSHHLDLARFLVGDVQAVSASARVFHGERSGEKVDVDDSFQALLEFKDGAIGVLDVSRVSAGHLLHSSVEVEGDRAALTFDLARLNELTLSDRRGRRTVHVSEPEHPFMAHWWPPGHALGWGDSFIHELHHFVSAVAGEGSVPPLGASFEDGYRCAEITDALLRSAVTHRRERVAYRPVRNG
jgi:predicted dehydrogenase